MHKIKDKDTGQAVELLWSLYLILKLSKQLRPRGGKKISHYCHKCHYKMFHHFNLYLHTHTHTHTLQPTVKWWSDNSSAYSVWSEGGCRWHRSASQWWLCSLISRPDGPPCLWPGGRPDTHPESLCPYQVRLSAGRLVERGARHGAKITTATDFTATQRLLKLASKPVRRNHFRIRTLENMWLQATFVFWTDHMKCLLKMFLSTLDIWWYLTAPLGFTV